MMGLVIFVGTMLPAGTQVVDYLVVIGLCKYTVAMHQDGVVDAFEALAGVGVAETVAQIKGIAALALTGIGASGLCG